MDDFFSKPMKLVTLAAAGDALILAAVWRKWGPTVSYTPAFLRDSYFNSYLVFFWASWWLHFWGWLWYRLILKPKYLSKMRHLPEPTVSFFAVDFFKSSGSEVWNTLLTHSTERQELVVWVRGSNL